MLRNIYQIVINTLLIVILIGCSCNKKNDLELPVVPVIEEPEIEIVDPFIASELDYTRAIATVSPQISLKKKRSKNLLTPTKTKTKKNHITKQAQELDLIKYDSGLKYEILRNGPNSGALPKQGQTITTHYALWYEEQGQPGELIDSTYERGLPFEFKIGLGQVIRAWDEGLMDMRVGDKRRFYVPSELAWGQAGAAQFIPSNTDLIYEIEILGIR